MKRHKFVEMMHCQTCFGIHMKRVVKAEEKRKNLPTPIILSPKQYKACQKYGYPEGLMHVSEFA